MKIILLVLTFFTSILFGQTIVTDRPDQTESSSAVPFNSFQIESGLTLTHLGEQRENIKILALPSTLFRYGLLEGFELRLFSQFQQIETNVDSLQTTGSGFSDPAVGFKLQILDAGSGHTEIAFLSHLYFPTGSFGSRENHYVSESKLAISHELGKDHALGYNIGYIYGGGGNGALTYSLVLGFGINEQLGIFAEPFGEWVEFEHFFHHFNCGFTYLLRDNLQADFALGTGINETLNFYTFGISWNISD